MYFYKTLLFPESNTIDNYLNCKSHKVILCDPYDTIVKDAASLKTGISKNVLLKLPNHIKHFDSYTNQIKSNDVSVLDMLLNKNEKEQLIDSILFIFESILEYENEKNVFKRRGTSPERNALLSRGGSKNIKYTAFKKSEGNSEFELATSESEENCIKSLIKELLFIFSRFESAGDCLSSLKRIKSEKNKIIFINVRLNLYKLEFFQ